MKKKSSYIPSKAHLLKKTHPTSGDKKNLFLRQKIPFLIISIVKGRMSKKDLRPFTKNEIILRVLDKITDPNSPHYAGSGAPFIKHETLVKFVKHGPDSMTKGEKEGMLRSYEIIEKYFDALTGRKAASLNPDGIPYLVPWSQNRKCYVYNPKAETSEGRRKKSQTDS